jgi:hypothetical protein
LNNARIGDTMHAHAYGLKEGDGFSLSLATRISTNSAGVARALGLQAESTIEIETILADLERKMSKRTLFTLESSPVPIEGEMPTE